MLKKTALIAILVVSSAVPVAWGQEDPGSEEDPIEASDEYVSDSDEYVSDSDDAGAAEISDEADAEASFDEDAIADESDESDEMTDTEDSSDEAFASDGEGESDGDVAAVQDEEEESDDASADAGDADEWAAESGDETDASEIDACYRRTFEINPREIRGRLNLAYVHLDTGRHAEALAVLAEAMALDKDGDFRESLVEKQRQVLLRISLDARDALTQQLNRFRNFDAPTHAAFRPMRHSPE